MMLSASYSLVKEGANLEADPDCWVPSALWRVVIGVLAGLMFILPTKKLLDKYEVTLRSGTRASVGARLHSALIG